MLNSLVTDVTMVPRWKFFLFEKQVTEFPGVKEENILSAVDRYFEKLQESKGIETIIRM